MPYVHSVPFTLRKKTVRQIITALEAKNHHPSAQRLNSFVSAVQHMVSNYLGVYEHERLLKKATTRDKLRRLNTTIETLLAAYNDLDSLSRALLGMEHLNGVGEFRRQLEAMSISAGRALAKANALPPKFRQQWRLLIAETLAKYMRDYLEIKPKGVLFAELLGILDEALSTVGISLGDTDRLASEALAILRRT